MGVLDTSYTFSNTDTITSTKMNNIIDQSTFTSGAIFGNTLELISGQLKVRALGITSAELGANSVTSTAIANNAVTSAKLATNISVAGTFGIGTASFPTPTGSAPLYAARAWGRFSNQVGPASPINGGNIGTLTRTATGFYTLTFPANSIPQNPSIVASSDFITYTEVLTNSGGFATSVKFRIINADGVSANFTFLNVIVFA